MKTYIFLANGFEILETFSPVDVLKRCGAEVVTVSTEKDLFVSSSQNNIVKADVRTVVIISDALRYEVGYEISQQLRKEAGLTQKQIAEKMQVGQNSYSNWEKGIRTPIKPTIEKLAEVFEVSPDYLLGTTDDPRTQVDIDIDEAIEKSVAYDGKPITDNDREIIRNFLKEHLFYQFVCLLLKRLEVVYKYNLPLL